VDILINNAGILRDKTLAKMEPENWDAVMDVHLKGAYNVTRPAFLKNAGEPIRTDHFDHVGRRALRQLRADQLFRRQDRIGGIHEHP
jgi:NAD(P)-dependent dehydrogenase (short-subunit alcohol dehydrogenase family)